MRLFNKVAIVGTGLIGGSIALAIKRKRLAREIIGVSRHKKSLLLAKRKGAIDKGSQKLSIIKDADLLILATPVKAIINLAPKIAGIVKKECIVTDVGSAKEEIVSVFEKIFPNYVGSHPLAGSEKRSIANAHPDIFKGSLCILTPTENTNNKALKKIKVLWAKIGVKLVLLNPVIHDKILSFVSHLPHAVAFSLMGTMPQGYLKFASGGLKDTTRIVASDSELWSDIFLSNSKNVLEAIKSFRNNVSHLETALKKKDKKTLIHILREAQKKRASLVL